MAHLSLIVGGLHLTIILVVNCPFAEREIVNRNKFASHTLVKATWSQEPELCRAIDESRRSLVQFAKAYERREVRQTDFLVTVMRRDKEKLVPVGVLVEGIEVETIHGHEIANTLVCMPGARISCGFEQVIDWRYIDTFELEGGRLYKALFHLQPPVVKLKIGDKQRFLMEWGKDVKMDSEFRDLLRDVANLRYAEVERKLHADKSLHKKKARVPIPGLQNSADPRVRLSPTSISNYAARFGNARMITLLHDIGVLREDKGHYPPLTASAVRGNLETTRCMLELGFDVEVSDDCDHSPLTYAVHFEDHESVVALLLKHGADCNRRDNRARTPIFNACSVGIAKQLLAAGARVDLLDDQGSTCVQHHLEYGHTDIVELLVKHGAKREPHWELGLKESQAMEKGTEVLRDRFRATDPKGLEDFELSLSIDYGCVLPIRDIPLQRESK